MLPFLDREELRVMAMKGCLVFPKAPASLEHLPSDCLESCAGHSLWGGLTPLQRCSRYILQPQPTGQNAIEKIYQFFAGNGHGDASSNLERG